MQQTTKYKLNKPETDDTIAIAPLNENMDKVEAALDTKADATETAALRAGATAEAAARAAADGALDTRLQAIEAKHFLLGSYVGNGTSARQFPLGFTPKLVMVIPSDINASANQYVALPGNKVNITHDSSLLEIISGGFSVGLTVNARNQDYFYLVID